MQITAITALLLSSLTFADAVDFADLLRFTSVSTTTAYAVPGSTPNSHAPAVTQVPDGSTVETLDLRQAPAVPPAVPLPAVAPAPAVPDANANAAILPAVPAAPPVAPANPPAVAPAAPPAIPPTAPAAVPTTPHANPPAAAPTHDSLAFVTVQWVETWIGGTSRTWLPHTITIHQDALSGAAPLPGQGQIGMGALTGHPGVTKTIIEGAAKTVGPEWKMGAVAAMGLGIAGLI